MFHVYEYSCFQHHPRTIKAIKLLEASVKFAGPLPDGIVDEIRVPNQDAPLKFRDPLEEGEFVPALVWDDTQPLGWLNQAVDVNSKMFLVFGSF